MPRATRFTALAGPSTVTRLAALAMLAALATTSLVATAWAHPAGFASVNRYLGVGWSARGRLHFAYLVDFAEMPASIELERIDADHDGTVTPEEQRAYLDSRLPPLVAAWTVLVDGVKVTPAVTGSSLQIAPGEGGLETLRVAADVEASAPPETSGGDLQRAGIAVSVRDPGFAEFPGWRELAAEESPVAAVTAGATGQASDALAYGRGAGAPPRIDEGHFSFRWREEPGSPAQPTWRGRAGTALRWLAVMSSACALFVVAVRHRRRRRSSP